MIELPRKRAQRNKNTAAAWQGAGAESMGWMNDVGGVYYLAKREGIRRFLLSGVELNIARNLHPRICATNRHQRRAE